jgi:flagellar basal-body rod protein FlgF/flagellar basal-body rod protein FlgG
VLQGSLESSNSDAVRTTVAIMDLERTAQAMEKAISIFHNEFNKTAAQDIGRI